MALEEFDQVLYEIEQARHDIMSKLEDISNFANDKTSFSKDTADMSVRGDSGLPLADEDMAWDASAADTRVREWAGGDDKDKINWKKYQRAFVICDKDESESFGGYHLPFADIVDGKLKAVPRGVMAAGGALQGARGGMNAPENVKASAKTFLAKYYKKMGKDAPWDKKDMLESDDEYDETADTPDDREVDDDTVGTETKE